MAGFAFVLLAGCTGGENPPAKTGDDGGEAAVKITNRIDIPNKVIQNLGITFAQVESRRVEQTLRAPGQFESPPEARREYHTMLPGRVEILVTQYQQVEPGTPLFRLESPEWRKIQEGLAAADSAVIALSDERKVLQAERNAADESLKLYPARVEALNVLTQASVDHVASLVDTRDHWKTRVADLEELLKQGAGKASELAEARGQLKSTLSAIAEEDERKAEIAEQVAALNAEKQERQLSIAVLDSRLESKDSEIKTAEAAFDRALQSAAGSLGYAVEDLRSDDAWRTLDKFTVEATAAGVVNHVHASTGAWVDANTEIIATLDLTRLRFRAKALQADLGLLKEGLKAHVVPPEGGSLESAETAEGVLRLPVEADAGERVIDLLILFEKLPAWARPGVTAEAEVVYNPSAREQMAIPVRCVVQDGLDKVVFARDPDSRDKVIRATPQLGPSDGRWIVIYTDVMVGQDVVLDGVYELKLTGSGKAPKGGHFHADGTFHAGGHEGE
ncbi:MAG: HlyD family efflux transporter periplasmic adaptor subunit [Planctomycetes bacterium]|nr:HlyD family efflux transporter periplasmic adaptor subunit [Planctomycetota bacterium]